uniref:Peptidyl-tRNA hydrolase 2 isoform X2 n=1 Tax=Rhizophora mucronata TaxID=61149 RepID=A0A2P2L490_RHIMU
MLHDKTMELNTKDVSDFSDRQCYLLEHFVQVNLDFLLMRDG